MCNTANGPQLCNNTTNTQLIAGARNPSWNGVLFEPHYVVSPQMILLARYETMRMSQQSTPGSASNARQHFVVHHRIPL